MKEEVGKRIRQIREDMGMTKEKFAKLLGISGQYLGVVEHGKSYLSIDKLKILCNLTDLSSDYILFGKDENIISNTQKILTEFSNEQIEIGCETLQKLALLLKTKELLNVFICFEIYMLTLYKSFSKILINNVFYKRMYTYDEKIEKVIRVTFRRI